MLVEGDVGVKLTLDGVELDLRGEVDIGVDKGEDAGEVAGGTDS